MIVFVVLCLGIVAWLFYQKKIVSILDREKLLIWEVIMSNWKYKIDVEDVSVFDEIEQEYGLQITTKLRDFFVNYNAATPDNCHFVAGGVEKILGAVLSVNKADTDVDTIYTALPFYDGLVPFGIDPFGNYIAYSVAGGQVVFVNHETEEAVVVSDSLDAFVNMLY